MEPVLKAFGKIETKLDRPGPGPANGSADAAGGASKAEPSGSTSAPEAASTPAKPTAKSGNESIGHRTLEDAVMHLLRPMLREWLDDNLPRIVEDAVRREIAGAVKSKIEPVSKP
jgi:cell pole-organizing protein PopZ